MNHYEYDAHGNLRHYINGELRATVPPAGLDDYRAAFPDAPAAVQEESHE